MAPLSLLTSLNPKTARLKSDMDFVQFEKPIGFFNFIELEDYLSEKLGTEVDLVTEDALKPLIRPHVMEKITYL